MQVSILGPVALTRDGAPVPVGGTRVRALLARLAVAQGAAVRSDLLVEAVWPEDRPGDATNALQTLVSRLRRAMGDASAVLQGPAGYRLQITADDVDAHRFTDLVRAGRDDLRAGDAAAAEKRLAEALGLWRGSPLPELDQPALVSRLEEQRVDALEDFLDARIQLGQGADLVGEAEGLAAAYPLRERFTGLRMAALDAAGRANEALAAYEQLRRFLGDELGTDPGPELQQLHLDLLQREPRPVARTARRTNLRAARTTFLGRSEELQRIDDLFAGGRLVTIVGPGGAGKTRLAGVAAAEWIDRLEDGVWLVELAPVTDPLNLAQALLGSLGLRSNAIVDRRAEQAMSTEDRLFDVLADSDGLLVLDNCEHVITDVAALTDQLLGSCPRLRVLATSREPLGIDGEALCLLTPFELPAIGAGVEEALAAASVQLFTDRAAAASGDFVVDDETVAAVIEIVRRLDGLPLAIELAAARLRVLPVQEIAARLSDRFRLLTGGNRAAMPRHRTLRAVVEWSWELLTPAEQLLAERLAVFPSGATIESATNVCADPNLPAGLPGDPGDIADLLSALVDKSLLQSGRGERTGLRYRMLETLREFGVEQLAARAEVDDVRRVHARYFADFLTEAEPHFTRAEQLDWIRRLEDEMDNVLAALRYLGDTGDAVAAIGMTRALGLYWTLLGGQSEATTWLRFALDVPDPDAVVPPRDRVVVEALQAINTMATSFGTAGADEVEEGLAHLTDLNLRLGDVDATSNPIIVMLRPMMLFFTGQYDQVFELLGEAVLAPDPWVRATSYMFRAAINENDGQIEAMRADVNTALELFTEIGDRWGLASTLSTRGQLHVLDGEIPEAIAAFERAAAHMAEFGATADEIMFHLRLSGLYTRIGDYDRARQEADLVATLDFQAGSRTQHMLADSVTATVAVLLGDEAEMQRLATRMTGDIEQLDTVHPMNGHLRSLGLAVLGCLRTELGELDTAAEILAGAMIGAVATRDMPIVASVGLAVAGWAEADDRADDAARMLGATIALRGADDSTDPLTVRLRARLDAALGADRLTAAVAEGMAMDRDTALAVLTPERPSARIA